MEYNESKTEKRRSKHNFFSELFICWVCPVLFNGNRRDVEESDLIVPSKEFDSECVGEKLERYWDEEIKRCKQKNKEPSLRRALCGAFWLNYMPGAVFLIIYAITRTLQPMLFTRLLSYWSVDVTMTKKEAYFYALGMLTLNFIGLMCQHHNSLFVSRYSLKLKTACSSLMFRKLLRMSQVSIGDVASGKLVNLMSNDIARFDYSFMFLHYLWLVPVQTAVVLYFLYTTAGLAPIAGLLGVVIFIFPIEAALTKMTAVLRRKTAKKTDNRIKIMTEIINGIQVIKMYAWEKPFRSVVKISRAHETKAIRNNMIVRSVFMGFIMFTERTILLVTCCMLILTGTMVKATTIYPIQQYFSIIFFNIAIILPFAITSLTEVAVSLERIQEFLVMDEKKDFTHENYVGVESDDDIKYVKQQNDDINETSEKDEITDTTDVIPLHRDDSKTYDYAVELTGVNATWDENASSSAETTLKNLNIRILRGKLCAIIGPVGAGKTSFLQLILKELPIKEGNMNIKGKISYACQESWLFSGTVRQNILFGLPYDAVKYKEICKVCSLLPDLKQFPYGDLSLVGERGVALSGGQRARINLARAIYREADIYLLDDPLSAVDANVGRQLYERCIGGYLRDRTCILVTHQIHFLKNADCIVVLNEGSIEMVGAYDEIMKSESSQFLSSLDPITQNDLKPEKEIKRMSVMRGMSKISIRSDENPEAQKEQIQAAEERAKGNLKWKVLWQYLRAVQSWCLILCVVMAMGLTQTAAASADYWLSFWTNRVDEYEQALPEEEEIDPSFGILIGYFTIGQYLMIYGGFILTVIVFLHVRIITFVTMAVKASRNLHDAVFENLIRAVMRFFDNNPSGRVLNRFSKDMGSMDEIMPRSFLETIQMYLSMSSILVLNAIALPWTLIPTLLLLTIFIFILKWYLNAAQSIKRLEGITKSPVFGMINSTIAGLTTIRSSNSQNRLIKEFDKTQDIYSSAFYTFVGGSSAFGLYLDILCLLYLATVIYIFISIDVGEITAVGSVGLAVTQTLNLTIMLQNGARLTADFMAQMTSVERVLEYTKLPSEENIDKGPTVPPKDWPMKGHVRFDDVCLRYGPEDPLVLKSLNFEIMSGWKVGIVGRTGAGKSSMISALFRLSDITGSIQIDNIDTSDVSKQLLRSKISIIPQEPVLFSASLRYNLDPFNHYSDADLWRALEQVELKDTITSLEFKVSEGGSNFSMGQRQLICLARAILRSNKILVMDEATANVDPQTDALIQKTIRRQFASCTVLTIAHRLNTIMDSDRVLVMDNGYLAEFNYPYLLLLDSKSKFSSMVKEAGENMSKILFEIAQAKYKSDQVR